MRDSLIVLFITIATVGGYFAFTKYRTLGPNVGTAQEMPTAASRENLVRKSSKPSSKQLVRKGVLKHDQQPVRQRVTTKNHGKDEGAPVDFNSAESFASIYETEGTGSAGGEHRPEPVNSGESSFGGRAQQKVVHGVPVDAWVRSRKGRLAQKPKAQPETGFRVFVNCTEVTKSPETATHPDCAELLANKSVRPALKQMQY